MKEIEQLQELLKKLRTSVSYTSTLEVNSDIDCCIMLTDLIAKNINKERDNNENM